MRAAANLLSRATALYPEGDRRGRRLLPDLAHALSQLEEFDRARELIQTARAMFVDLGQTYALASSAESSGLVEMLAGDLLAAKSKRRGVGLLEGMGERAYLSTLGAMLADVLELVDRDDEAGRFARTSEKASDPDDIDSQARWRAVKPSSWPSRAGSKRLARPRGGAPWPRPPTSSTCTATATWRMVPCWRHWAARPRPAGVRPWSKRSAARATSRLPAKLRARMPPPARSAESLSLSRSQSRPHWSEMAISDASCEL